MWLQLREKYKVIAKHPLTADVLRLKKNTVAEITHVSDCNLSSVWLQKQVRWIAKRTHSMPNKKRRFTKIHCQSSKFTKIKTKKRRKRLPHHMI
jgi:hypothetical protein